VSKRRIVNLHLLFLAIVHYRIVYATTACHLKYEPTVYQVYQAFGRL